MVTFQGITTRGLHGKSAYLPSEDGNTTPRHLKHKGRSCGMCGKWFACRVQRRTTLALYGKEPMQRWGRLFDALECSHKMGLRVRSAQSNIVSGINNGKHGVNNNHILPRTFAKRFYAPNTRIFGKAAGSTAPWEAMDTDAIKSRNAFYTVTQVDGTDKLTLERFFQNIENRVPSWFKPSGVSPADRGEPEYWLAWFIAAQFLRTPLTAKMGRERSRPQMRHFPEAVYVLANLAQAETTARMIFSWHWELRAVGVYPGTDELLLGEHCVHRYAPDGNSHGIIFTICHNRVLICSPEWATQCVIKICGDAAEEQKLVQGLNRVTIQSNEEAKGYIYRLSPPSVS